MFMHRLRLKQTPLKHSIFGKATMTMWFVLWTWPGPRKRTQVWKQAWWRNSILPHHRKGWFSFTKFKIFRGWFQTSVIANAYSQVSRWPPNADISLVISKCESRSLSKSEDNSSPIFHRVIAESNEETCETNVSAKNDGENHVGKEESEVSIKKTEGDHIE